MPYTNTPGIEYELCNWLNLICSSVLNFFTALTTSFDDTDRLDVFVAHEPGGTSIQDMKYWQ